MIQRPYYLLLCLFQEEDESMAQGIGRLKPVREKRLTEVRTGSDKAGVGETTTARGRRSDDNRRRADDRLEHQVRSYKQGSNDAQKEFSDNGFRSRTSNGAPEMGIKNIVMDDSSVLQTVEILKRPGQTLGFYIREGNGFDRQDGVFISRIQVGTVADTNGLLHVGDEILTINNVEVRHMSLDDVVILMSIPKKLILKIRTKKNCNKKNASCPSLAMTEKEEPPVVVLKKGRSSSATALEMTEKSPDMFDPYSSPQSGQSYFSRVSSKPRTDKATSSRYASIFISPHKAEAKLLTGDEGDSENSSEGSLPRSLDSGRGGIYASQRGLGDAMFEGSGAFTSPPVSQYDISERDYKYMQLEGLHRKYAQTSPSKSSSLPPQFAQRGHFDSDKSLYDHYSYGIPMQDYSILRGTATHDSRRQMGLREILQSKAKYGRMSRSRSPECYNSDSEIIYTHPRGQVEPRGFASDYETYAGAASDDEPVYSIPHMPASSSTELQQLLQKFNTLSHELQHEQCKLQRQLSARERPGK